MKHVPQDEAQALDWLLPLLDTDDHPLTALTRLNLTPAEDFKRAWHAIGFLYAGLHPDDATNHGQRALNDATDYPPVSAREPRLLNPYFERSGWPVVLAPIAAEAWRRYDGGELTDDEFYCCDALQAGMDHRIALHEASVGVSHAKKYET